MRKHKSDADIWAEHFKSDDSMDGFKTQPGPPLKNVPQTEEEQKAFLEQVKFWKSKESNKRDSLEKRVEELESELKKVKKYINYMSRKSNKRVSESTQQPQIQQPIKREDETQNQ